MEEQLQQEIESLSSLCAAQQQLLDHATALLINHFSDYHDRFEKIVDEFVDRHGLRESLLRELAADDDLQKNNAACAKAQRDYVRVQAVHMANFRKLRNLENAVLGGIVTDLRERLKSQHTSRPPNLV